MHVFVTLTNAGHGFTPYPFTFNLSHLVSFAPGSGGTLLEFVDREVYVVEPYQWVVQALAYDSSTYSRDEAAPEVRVLNRQKPEEPEP